MRLGFEGFGDGAPKKRIVTNAEQHCYSCYTSQKSKGYVFSEIEP